MTRHLRWLGPALVCVWLLLPEMSWAQGLPMVNVSNGKTGQQYSLT
mgnify:FL=1